MFSDSAFVLEPQTSLSRMIKPQQLLPPKKNKIKKNTMVAPGLGLKEKACRLLYFIAVSFFLNDFYSSAKYEEREMTVSLVSLSFRRLHPFISRASCSINDRRSISLSITPAVSINATRLRRPHAYISASSRLSISSPSPP